MDFDPALYTRAPVIDLASGITLADTLVGISPKNMPAHVKKAARKLAQVVTGARDAIAQRQRAAGLSEEGTRGIDQAADSSWSILRMRLQACAALPLDAFPEAERAGELAVILFGSDGLTFLQTAYPIQLSKASAILQRIDEDHLEADIDALAGPEYLQNVRQQHAAYDAMVKGMLTRTDSSSLLEHVRLLQRGIVSYATKVCSTVDDDEPDTIDIARTALRPIDMFRDSRAARSPSPAAAPAPAATEPSAAAAQPAAAPTEPPAGEL